MSRGGKREGAGRKPNPDKKVPISAKVPPTVGQFLREHGVSKTIEEAVSKTKAYREWCRAR